jgi:hypothetical protein
MNSRKVSRMKANHRKALLLTFVIAGIALPAAAVDRVKAGQWVGEWTGGGRTRPTSTCMTPSDAAALNGDIRSVGTYLQKIVPPTICKITNLRTNGGEITYTSVCNGKENAITTTYHGNSFESTDSSGAKSQAKWTGPCK